MLRKLKIFTVLLISYLYYSPLWAQNCYDNLGVYQSPINFHDSAFSRDAFHIPLSYFLSISSPNALVPYYNTWPTGSTGFKLKLDSTENEENIKFSNKHPEDYQLYYEGHIYNLIEFHFHSPGEHTFTGKNGTIFDMEMHMVFKPQDIGNNTPGLVIGVPIKLGTTPSTFDSNLSAILTTVTPTAGQTIQVPGSLFSSCLNYNNSINFPPSFIYPGSLTTKPYTEGFTWIVLNGFLVSPPIISQNTLTLFNSKKVNNKTVGSVRKLQYRYGRPIISYIPSNPTPYIGQKYGGGVIGYLLQPGDPGYSANIPHGLIVANYDYYPKGAYWACGDTFPQPDTSTAIGTGANNTKKMMGPCIYDGSGDLVAPQFAHSYRGGGYSDWFIPSLNELNAIYKNIGIINNSLAYQYSTTQNAWQPGGGSNYLSSSFTGYTGGGYLNGYGFYMVSFYSGNVNSMVWAGTGYAQMILIRSF